MSRPDLLTAGVRLGVESRLVEVVGVAERRDADHRGDKAGEPERSRRARPGEKQASAAITAVPLIIAKPSLGRSRSGASPAAASASAAGIRRPSETRRARRTAPRRRKTAA